jgi:hypothetical protein
MNNCRAQNKDNQSLMFLSRKDANITHGFLSEHQNNQVTYIDHKGNLQPQQLLKEKNYFKN